MMLTGNIGEQYTSEKKQSKATFLKKFKETQPAHY
ncbi:MAG: hypothetical protein ACLTW7_16040 [Enterococcus sp.]